MDLSQVPAAQRAQYLRTVSQLEATPPQVRAMIAQEAIASQQSIMPVIYYSTIRFKSARTGAGPFTYTIDTSVRKAFTYKEGDAMDAAGFAAGTAATRAETNLISGGSQTNDNSDVVVWGLGIEFLPTSEPRLLAECVREVFVELSLNGQSRFLLGKLSDFPSAGGTYGQQHTKLEAGQLVETVGPMEGWLANGNPMAGNFFKLPYPIRWNSIGSGKKDTALAISMTPAHTITQTATDRAANAGAAPGLSGRVEAFTSPADLARGTFVEVRVKLATVQIGERSINS